MFCEHCGAQNPETASYCRACGKRMEGKRENQAHHHIFQGTILFLAGPLTGRSFPITPPAMTLGRDPHNTIVIPDPAVSPFYARLVLTRSGWVVEVLAPQNTLMVNQNQTRQQLIRDQDVISLGSATVFRCALKTGMPYYPQPLVPRPQQVRSGMRLSRRTVLIGGAALAGGLLLLVGGGKILSSRFSQPQPFQHVALGTHLVTYQGHDESVWSVAWSPDSTRIASGGSRYGATVEVWNALDGTTVYNQPYTPPLSIIATVESLAWSPDGTRIVIDETGNYEDVHAWDAADGGHDTKFELPSTLLITHVSQVAWSPDSKRIAAACESTDLTTSNNHAGTVLVWDVASAKTLTYYTTQSDVKSVAWSLDSQRIAAAIENTVQVLSVGSWQPLSTYQGHSDLVWSVAWSPDGRRIASGSSDNTVQVWDATNANTLSTYRRHTKTVETAYSVT